MTSICNLTSAYRGQCQCKEDFTIILHMGNGILILCLLLAGLMFLCKMYREGYRKQYRRRHYVWIGTALLFHYIVFVIFHVLDITSMKADTNPTTIVDYLDKDGSKFSFSWQLFLLVFFAFTSLFLFVAEGIDVYQSTKPDYQANNSSRQFFVCLVCIFTSAILSVCTAVAIPKNLENKKTLSCKEDSEDVLPTTPYDSRVYVKTFPPSGFYVSLSFIAFATIVILALASQNLTSNYVFRGRPDKLLMDRVRTIRNRIKVDAVMLLLTILALALWYPAFYFRKFQIDPFIWVSVLYVLINFVEGIAFLRLFWSSENAVADASMENPEDTSMQEVSSMKHPNGHVVSGDVPQPPVEHPPDNTSHNQVDRDLEANIEHLSPAVPNGLPPLANGHAVPKKNTSSRSVLVSPLPQRTDKQTAPQRNTTHLTFNANDPTPLRAVEEAHGSSDEVGSNADSSVPAVTNEITQQSVQGKESVPPVLSEQAGNQQCVDDTDDVTTNDKIMDAELDQES